MLTTKFLKKYGNANPELQSYIDGQVMKFMSANRLTETNLRELDEKIQTEKTLIEKKEQIKAERTRRPQNEVLSNAPSQTSQVSKRPSTAKPASVKPKSRFGDNLSDLKSQRSFVSKVSLAKSNKPAQKPAVVKRVTDKDSVITPSVQKSVSVVSSVDEVDEWTAIQNFNAVIHYEEQKQTAQRQADRKRLLRQELDAQRKAKVAKANKLKQEDSAYDVALQEYLKVFDQKEDQKAKQVKEKIMKEKEMRDEQLRKMQHKKRKETRDNHQ